MGVVCRGLFKVVYWGSFGDKVVRLVKVVILLGIVKNFIDLFKLYDLYLWLFLLVLMVFELIFGCLVECFDEGVLVLVVI